MAFIYYKFFVLLVFLKLFNAQMAIGQVLFPNTPELDYYELLLLKNPKFNDPITLFPSIIGDYNIADSTLTWDIWGIGNQYHAKNEKLFLINPSYNVVYNSKYPKAENDGPAWAGKGLSTSLNFGAGGKLGVFHYMLAPSINYSQNQEFEIPDRIFNKSQYSYPFENKIDWVMRYGNNTYFNIDWGQSELRVTHKNFTLGLSTQNMKWGPAKYYPIIMSNNAAGFPHLDIGTAAPVKTKIGDIEFKSFWGILTASDYFNLTHNRNKSFFTGFVFGYQPKYINGLSLGLTRAMYRDLSLRSLNFRDVFRNISGLDPNQGAFHNGRWVNDLYDQLMSATLEWKFIEVGFEAYLELARNDFNGGIRDKILEPDHSSTFILGFVKTLDFDNGSIFKINYEHANLKTFRSSDLEGRPTPTYYVHLLTVNGYTQNGQLIGAAIGPGSNADVLELNYIFKSGLISLKAQRITFNNDYFFRTILDIQRHDVEYSFAIKYVKIYPKFNIAIGLMNSNRLNWYYELQKDVKNWQTSVNISYKLNR